MKRIYEVEGRVDNTMVKRFNKALPEYALKSYPTFLLVMLLVIVGYCFSDVLVRKEIRFLYSRIPTILISLFILGVYYSPLKKDGKLVVLLNNLYTFSLLFMGFSLLILSFNKPEFKSAITALIMLTMASYFFIKGLRSIIIVYGGSFFLAIIYLLIYKTFTPEQVHEIIMPLASFGCIVIASILAEKSRYKEYYFQQNLEKEKANKEQLYSQAEEQNNELTLLNENLTEIRFNLEEANQTKDKLFSIIAHDLRNAFNVLICYSDLLADEKNAISNQDRKEAIQRLLSTSKSTFSLLENLLEWAMSQSGKIENNPKLYNCQEIVDDVVSHLIHNADNKGVKVNIKEKEERKVYVDENIFKTILRNIISNAIKYSYNSGTINIEISSEGVYTSVTVQDFGTGMKKEQMDSLFRADMNQSERGTDNEKGTGLGMVLVKEFVDLLKGKLHIESEEGKGTVVTVLLPSRN